MFSLKELFDKQVQVTLDDSWNCPWPGGGKTADEKLWYYEIKGKRGTIYPQSETEVTVEVSTRLGKKLISLFGPNCRVRRVCDEGMDIVIPVKLIKSTFRYIKPKFRKQLSQAQKDVLIARLRAAKLPQE